VNQEVIDAYMMEFYQSGLICQMSWLGTPIWKTPCDLWIYQEMLHDVRPAAVIECGTSSGGTSAWLAAVLGMIGDGRVLTIDIAPQPVYPQHPALTYHFGNTTSPERLVAVQEWLGGCSPVMAILDSDHKADHVLRELDLYGPLITPGSYLIVEDTHINHPWKVPGIDRGPAEALADWLPQHPEFAPDLARERFGMTLCRGGFLRRAQ